MRTVLLANNRLGARIAALLHERGELQALVLHPPDLRTEAGAFERLPVDTYVWPDGLAAVERDRPECLLSVLFAYKVPPEWLALASWRACNLHPALLPFNRGSAPNAWPLVDGTPAGTTLHVMDAAIDTGAILCQRAVETTPSDTAFSLYRRLEDASFDMFREVWPDLRSREPKPQAPGGTSHRLADLARLDLNDDDLAVVDKLRARTFPPHGAEFTRDGRRYRARIEIEPLDG
ncbi:MAG TPA: formyltransferase family protein [Acidimicrobiia bacterium]|nr:formyltransferase family protein [Acidimicrobiia bacterium]